jgi:hypothetical protein
MNAHALAARFVRREPGVGEAPELVDVPHSVEAEAAVLGALLIDRAAWDRVRDVLGEADIYRAAHRAIWRAIERVRHEDQAADVLTVAEALRAAGELEDVGGLAYLQGLANSTPSAANVAAYAKIVRDRDRQRRLAGNFETLRVAALAPGANLEELRAEGEKALAEIPRRTEHMQPLDLRDLSTKSPPDRVWAMLWWIAMGHAHLLVGAGGIGKSTILMQLAACLALARHFVDEIPAALRVLMWLCEDDAAEIWRRLVAIAKWLDVPLEMLAENLHIVPRHGCENVLYTNEGGRLRFTPTLAELRKQALDLGAHVVMLDNLAHVFGADENKRHDVTTFLNGLAGALPGCALILAGHPSRAEGSEFSGSSAWENAVRARFYLGRSLPDQKPGEADDDLDDTVRFLARRKANYSARDWRRFTFANGVLVPDEVEAAGGMVAHLRTQRAEQVVLDGARRLRAMGVRVTDGATSPQYLPRVLLDYKLADGCTKRELSNATRAAMLDGKLVRAKVGQYAGNRSPMFGLVVAGE